MRGEETDNVIACIKARQKPQYKRYLISKILELFHMESYINVCMNRILSRADEIDSSHLYCPMNFDFNNFSVDYIGYMQFEDIISGYIGEEESEKLQRLFESDHDIIRLERTMVNFLFELGNKELKRLGNDLKTLNTHTESNELLIKYVNIEIKARNKANVMYWSLVKKIAKLIKEIRTKLLAKRLLKGGNA